MPTLGSTLIQNARRVPDREALVHDGRRWSWAGLADAARRTAGALDALGLGPGDRFAVLSGNRAEYVVAEYAALLLGAIVVPVNARSAPPEIATVLADSGATVVAVGPDCDVPDGGRARVVALVDLVGTDAPPIEGDRAEETTDAFLTYTSGTTGRPKGVLVDHHRAIWAALSQITSLGMRDGERYLHLSPFHHSGGVVFTSAVTLLGGTHVVGPPFEPGAVLQMLEEERIESFLGVPTMYQQLLRHPDLDHRDLSRLRTGVFGAAAMPETALRELLTRLPGIELRQLCGQTESGPTGLFSTTAQLRERPDATGHQPQPFLEHRIRTREGRDAGPSEIGELLFRGPAVMKRYWNAPEATAETLRDGWLHTGDLFRVDPDGALVLVDRLKDMIITGGRNVYSAEVEQVVATHPAVADCAVLGRLHPEYGETVVAVVTVHPGSGIAIAELREHCASRLAPYKIPRDLLVAPVPRNASGKVQKHLLRDLIAVPPEGAPA
ncbi:class I adenylate-forming enzyme family protein [Pseudonocardia spirodelae]|uniref:AMP-binding protein n=1 Tax=Pseudonocardia spirodelae TaxID=3133431 RepID=A0ABU8T6B9_9PSEU